MPPDSRQHIVRAFVQSIGGHAGLAARYGINPRTAQRIYSGKAACPRAILADAEAHERDRADG